MSENEVTTLPEVEGEPSGRQQRNGGRVSAWVQGHTPLAISIVGLFSSALTLLAANPVILSQFGVADPEGGHSLDKVTAEIAEPSGRDTSRSGILEISGSFGGELQGRSLWAFVKNLDNGTLWPSYEPCSIAEKKWTCKVTPLPGGSELQVRLVDSRSVNEILQWVMKENDGNASALNKVSHSKILAHSALSG
ncbi:hypothetical protein [Streptomyces sp. MA5143a]|uniref:hypothetical protein n=1 Tax=Streptomyces sp. MA5143a TaxID=2083010 RepID=UPI0011B2501E|nr:hypothetical protein [Streptomyces sp. MA5143a]